MMATRLRHWNYFSVFMVPADKVLDLEGILIAAIPKAANSAKTRMTEIRLSAKVKRLLSLYKRISIDELLNK